MGCGEEKRGGIDGRVRLAEVGIPWYLYTATTPDGSLSPTCLTPNHMIFRAILDDLQAVAEVEVPASR